MIQVRSDIEGIVRYFVGTRALSSSNQLRTTTMLVGADVPSGPSRLDEAGGVPGEHRPTNDTLLDPVFGMNWSSVEDDLNGDGTADGHQTITNTYDRHGNLLLSIILSDRDDDTDGTVDPRWSTTITNTYDSRRNVLTMVIDLTDGNGIVIRHQIGIFTYDAKGNKILDVSVSLVLNHAESLAVSSAWEHPRGGLMVGRLTGLASPCMDRM